MSAAARSVPNAPGERAELVAGIRRLGTLFACAILPAITIVLLFVTAIRDDAIATDLGQFYRAAELLLEGESPYAPEAGAVTEWGGPFPYPPLPGLAAIPLTALSIDTAGVLVMAALLVAVLGVLFLLGVRDWRCYGLVLLWPPVLSAIQAGNVTLWFALASALVWRFRDRLLLPSASLGLALATKFFLWPVAVWLAATRRLAAAVLSCAIGAAALLFSWAAISFAGFTSYPDILRELERAVGEDSYTVYIVGLDLGLPSPVARAAWLALGLALVAAVVLVARRGDERTSFVLAVAAGLALTPIVWLHYFALLVVVVAVAQPTLSAVWFVPLAMVLTPGSGHPTPFETAWTLAVAACTIALALRASVRAGRTVASPAGSGMEPAVVRVSAGEP